MKITYLDKWYAVCSSQAAQLTVLMALVHVVLKWKIPTTYQSHIYKSTDLKLGKVDDVTRFTNAAKFGKDRISGGAPSWWWNIRVVCLLFFFLYFFYSLTRVQPLPVKQFSHEIAQKMRTDSRKCPLSKFSSIFSLFGVIFPPNPHNFAAGWEVSAKR